MDKKLADLVSIGWPASGENCCVFVTLGENICCYASNGCDTVRNGAYSNGQELHNISRCV